MSQHVLLIGDFTPLTLSHLDDINHAASIADNVHIIIKKPVARPLPSGRMAGIHDAARWLQVSCQAFGFVHIHTEESLGWVHQYDHLGSDNIYHDSLTDSDLENLCQLLTIDKQSTILYHPKLSENDLAHRRIVRDRPLQHFGELAPACRYFYTQTVCIVGGESSGKTTLLHKLAGHYGASIALEMGRLYTHSHLGGTELGLQYSDYMPIAINHAKAIMDATASASAPVTLVDTDFATTQAFCEVYENRTHPVVASLADEMRMDLTIYLDNNVAWVADGMRRLGGAARSHFAQKLLDILARHEIDHHRIDDPDYHQRYLKTITVIDQHLYSK